MLLVATDPAFEQHDTGPGHPERVQRLAAALRGPEAAGLTDAVRLLEPREATLERAQPGPSRRLPRGPGALLRRRRRRHRRRHPGVGRVLAGREAGRRGRAGGGRGAPAGRGRRRLPGRPPAGPPRPGHPADGVLPDQQHRRGGRQPGRAGGAGPRPRLGRPPRQRHRSHLLGRPPGAVRVDAPVRLLLSRGRAPSTTSAGPGPGGRRSTCRSRPAPPATSTCGPSTRSSAPAVEAFAPTWVLVSAGYDAHRADPLTGLRLSAGDFADIARRVAGFAPEPGRLVLFLEGGYDLDALTTRSAPAWPPCSTRPYRPEAATSGGPGRRGGRSGPLPAGATRRSAPNGQNGGSRRMAAQAEPSTCRSLGQTCPPS